MITGTNETMNDDFRQRVRNELISKVIDQVLEQLDFSFEYNFNACITFDSQSRLQIRNLISTTLEEIFDHEFCTNFMFQMDTNAIANHIAGKVNKENHFNVVRSNGENHGLNMDGLCKIIFNLSSTNLLNATKVLINASQKDYLTGEGKDWIDPIPLLSISANNQLNLEEVRQLVYSAMTSVRRELEQQLEQKRYRNRNMWTQRRFDSTQNETALSNSNSTASSSAASSSTAIVNVPMVDSQNIIRRSDFEWHQPDDKDSNTVEVTRPTKRQRRR